MLFGAECKCGCGRMCDGVRQHYASNACRQRAYRERRNLLPERLPRESEQNYRWRLKRIERLNGSVTVAR